MWECTSNIAFSDSPLCHVNTDSPTALWSSAGQARVLIWNQGLIVERPESHEDLCMIFMPAVFTIKRGAGRARANVAACPRLHRSNGTNAVWLLNTSWLMLFRNGSCSSFSSSICLTVVCFCYLKRSTSVGSGFSNCSVEKHCSVCSIVSFLIRGVKQRSSNNHRHLRADNKINCFWCPWRLQTDTNDVFMINLVYPLTSEPYRQTCQRRVIYQAPQLLDVN